MKKGILPLLILGGVGVVLLSSKKSSAKSNKFEDLPAPDDNGSAQPPAGDGDGDAPLPGVDDQPDGGAASVHPMYDHCMRNGGVELQTWIDAETGGEYAVCVFGDGSLGRTFQFWADGVKVPPAEGDYPKDLTPRPAPSGGEFPPPPDTRTV